MEVDAIGVLALFSSTLCIGITIGICICSGVG